MNCSNCGAANDADARFCAECGTPLDNVAVETAKAEHVFSDTDEDATIMSAPDEIAIEAKTLAVGQTSVASDVEEDANKAEEVDDDSSSSEPEPAPSSSDPAPAAEADGGDQNGGDMDLGGGGGDGQKGNNRTMIIIGAIVLVLFLCCCCSVLVGGVIGSDPGMIEDLIEEIAMLPAYLV